MKFFINRQLIILAMVMVLFISGCGLKIESPFGDPAEPVATVDTGQITKTVLAEIEAQLAVRSEEQATLLEGQVINEVRARAEELVEAAESEVDTESIVARTFFECQAQTRFKSSSNAG